MSNSEPSAIVLQGILCICGLYKLRFEWRKRFAQGPPRFNLLDILLLSVTEQDFDEQSRNFLNLEQVSRLQICGNKVCGLAGCPSMRNCQKLDLSG